VFLLFKPRLKGKKKEIKKEKTKRYSGSIMKPRMYREKREIDDPRSRSSPNDPPFPSEYFVTMRPMENKQLNTGKERRLIFGPLHV